MNVLVRAVGEHHNFARAATDAAGILADAKRRGKGQVGEIGGDVMECGINI